MNSDLEVMSKLYLRIYPDSALRSGATPVKDVNGAVHELIESMGEVMYTYQGIGLAAPQVGVLQRVILADVGEGLVALANPQILEAEGLDQLEEGCLSLPEIQVEVKRKQSALVQGVNPEGKQVSLEVRGLLARVIQHEIDHLNGVLIIDHASPIVRGFLAKKLRKLRKGA